MKGFPGDAWKWLAIACFVWYAAVTAWVAIRGLFDIRSMLARLRGDAERGHASGGAAGGTRGDAAGRARDRSDGDV